MWFRGGWGVEEGGRGTAKGKGEIDMYFVTGALRQSTNGINA